MTLLEEIMAGGFDLVHRDDGAIAQALSVGRTKVITKLGGVGLIMEALGPQIGAALLDQLETQAQTNSAVKWAFVLINRGELDFGSPATRTMIDQLVPEPSRSVLKNVAVVPDVVTPQQVAFALEGQ